MQPKFDINQLHIASPCQAAWEGMIGNDQVRRCETCRLNVYNTAAMTSADVERMVLSAEGRVCMRLYRRGDGTVMTRDCPVGLRKYARRVSRLVSVAAAALLAFATSAFGQDAVIKATDAKVRVTRSKPEDGRSSLSGTVTDVAGAAIAGADIELTRDGLPFTKARSDEDGRFDLGQLIDGSYTVRILRPGFRQAVITIADLRAAAPLALNVTMNIGELLGEIVLITERTQPLDPPSLPISTNITLRKTNYR